MRGHASLSARLQKGSFPTESVKRMYMCIHFKTY